MDEIQCALSTNRGGHTIWAIKGEMAFILLGIIHRYMPFFLILFQDHEGEKSAKHYAGLRGIIR